MSESETEAAEESLSESSETGLTVSPGGDHDELTDGVIRSHTIWAVCAGALPIPLFDIAAVTAVQMDALKQLAKIHDIDYSNATGKRFVTALTGSAAARLGASLFKIIPGVGTVLGGLSMMAFSGASTYAVCQVAVSHFKTHGDFLELDFDVAKRAYKVALEKGKEMVKKFEGKQKEARESYRLLKELESLRDAGVLSEEEFETKSAEIFRDLG